MESSSAGFQGKNLGPSGILTAVATSTATAITAVVLWFIGYDVSSDSSSRAVAVTSTAMTTRTTRMEAVTTAAANNGISDSSVGSSYNSSGVDS